MVAAKDNPTIVFVMAGNEDEAAKIARSLVEQRLAACVNIVGPVRSLYRWRGLIEDEREYLLVIKTRARLYAKLEDQVRKMHSYDVPEIIAIAVAKGSKPYLDWVLESTAAVTRAPREALRRRPVTASRS